VQHEFVLRAESPGIPPLRFSLSSDGKLAAAKSKSTELQVLRCETNGLLTVMWGDRIVTGVLTISGERRDTLSIQLAGTNFSLRRRAAAIDELEQNIAAASQSGGVTEIKSPIPGLVKAIAIKAGDAVASGQTLVVLEAMKMENEIAAPRAGTIQSLEVQPGQAVAAGAILLKLST
jgi:biotin carboxyl carrier protein